MQHTLSPAAAAAVERINAWRTRHREALARELSSPAADPVEHAEELARHRAAIHAYTAARLAIIVADEHHAAG